MSPPPPHVHSHAPAAASASAYASAYATVIASSKPGLDHGFSHSHLAQSVRVEGHHPVSQSASTSAADITDDRPSTSSSLETSSSSSPSSHFTAHSGSSYARPKPLRYYRYKLRWRNGADLTKPYHAFELAPSSCASSALPFPPPPPVPDTLDLHQFFYIDPASNPSSSPIDTAAPSSYASASASASAATFSQPKTVLPTLPTSTSTAAPPNLRSPSRGRNQAPTAVSSTPASTPSAPTDAVAASPKNKPVSRSRSRAKQQHTAQPTPTPPAVPLIPPVQALAAAQQSAPPAKPALGFTWAKVAAQTTTHPPGRSPANAAPASVVKPPPPATTVANDFPVIESTASTPVPVHAHKPGAGAWTNSMSASKATTTSLSTSTTVTVNALPSKSQSSTAATTPTKRTATVPDFTPTSMLQFMQPDYSRPTTPEPVPPVAHPVRHASPTPTRRAPVEEQAADQAANGHARPLPSTPPAPSASSSANVEKKDEEKSRDGSPTPTAPRAAPTAPFSWAAAAAGPQPKPPSTPSPPAPVFTATVSAARPAIEVTTPTPTSAAPSEQATPVAPTTTSTTQSTPTPAAPSADAVAEPPTKPKPKQVTSWAALFDSGSKPTAAPTSTSTASASSTAGGLVSLGDLATAYVHDYVGGTPHARGLVNNGNMCFLNVILQPLIHCPPFRNLLRAVNKRVVAKIGGDDGGGDAKLIEAFVAFMGEYLGGGGGDQDVEQGDPLVPEPIYDVVRATKSRALVKGRQEDAEEFLGFLLDGLHDEFVKAIKQADEVKQRKAALSRTGSAEDVGVNGNGSGNEWLEVGTKHRTAVTRTVAATESPISSLFTGRIRSTLRVPGHKDSVTSEPFQSLPLDISPDHVLSVPDALHEIIRPETISEYPLPGGRGVVDGVTKQAKLERVPPILIMHLKRFLFDAARGDTVKVTKHVDVPMTLELEPRLWADKVRHQARAMSSSSSSGSAMGVTPRSRTPSPVRPSGGALSPTRFSALAPPSHTHLPLPSASQTPTSPGGSAGTGIGPHSHYRLFAIVYHHGRAANGGHYTCDVLESPKEGMWVRMDDTELQRVTTAEVVQHKHDREPYLLFYECAELVERVERPRGRAVGKPPAARAKSAGSRASSVGAQGKGRVNGLASKVGVEPAAPATATTASTTPLSVSAPTAAASAAAVAPPAPVAMSVDASASTLTALKDEQADVDRAIAASLADSGLFPPPPPSPPSPRPNEAEEEMPFMPVAAKKQKAKPAPQAHGRGRGSSSGGGRGGTSGNAGRGAGRGLSRGKRTGGAS